MKDSKQERKDIERRELIDQRTVRESENKKQSGKMGRGSEIFKRAFKLWSYFLSKLKKSIFKDGSPPSDPKNLKFKDIYKDSKLAIKKSCKTCKTHVDDQQIQCCPNCKTNNRTVFLTSKIFYRKQGQKEFFRKEYDQVELTSKAVDYFNRGEIDSVLTLRKRVKIPARAELIGLFNRAIYNREAA
ncbi:MAG: hypothetical protein BWY64_01586 [bacterium ADurb.Bin363]|nr:MAG: hypothetical protein BWY64_01586 [bacterium ADurb.Bin363]